MTFCTCVLLYLYRYSYGVEVLQLPPIANNNRFFIEALLSEKSADLIPVAVLREESGLFKPGTLTLSSLRTRYAHMTAAYESFNSFHVPVILPLSSRRYMFVCAFRADYAILLSARVWRMPLCVRDRVQCDHISTMHAWMFEGTPPVLTERSYSHSTKCRLVHDSFVRSFIQRISWLRCRITVLVESGRFNCDDLHISALQLFWNMDLGTDRRYRRCVEHSRVWVG